MQPNALHSQPHHTQGSIVHQLWISNVLPPLLKSFAFTLCTYLAVFRLYCSSSHEYLCPHTETPLPLQPPQSTWHCSAPGLLIECRLDAQRIVLPISAAGTPPGGPLFQDALIGVGLQSRQPGTLSSATKRSPLSTSPHPGVNCPPTLDFKRPASTA